MKNPIVSIAHASRRTGRLLPKLILPAAFCLATASAFADTEQWLGVPGTTATTNWTDSANWTPSVNQTYYNEVKFTTAGASANNNFSINNVLDDTTGVAQMPIWQLDYIPVNGNYTTLINPGKTLQLDAGWGSLYVGADALNNSSPAPADAVETISFTGPGAAISIAGGIYLGQGSTMPGDAHNVTLDFSGVDHFTMNSSHEIYVASGGLQRGNGSFYLAKTNNIVLGNVFQICNQSMSNSLPCAVELGIANDIAINGNNLVVGGGGAVAGAVLKFNPAFIGGATIPSAYLHSSSGRISTVYIGNGNGGAQVTSTGVCDFSGGNVYLLADSMQLGQAGSGNATGTLTFDNNYVDANNVIVGNQTAGSGGAGVGIVNLNNNPTLGTSSTLLVNQTLTLAAAAGTLTPGTAGTININGGTLLANTIVNGAGNGTLNVNGGNLTVKGTAGTAAAPVSNLNTTNSTLSLTIVAGTTNIYATSLKTGGTTNIISINAAPPYSSYPVQITLIKYGSLGGAGFNFGVGSLPPLYAGYLVNNPANGSIDIVFTSGATTLTWNGNLNANWDTTTANWLAGGIYADGQTVQFFDGASSGTVNLTTTLSPSSLTVSNSALNYTFNGSGALSGATGLTKTGSGALIIDNSGANNFSGAMTINSGTLQIGNNDANGNLPAGNIVNNGTLAMARSDSSTLNNTISGSGSVTQSGGTLLLSGNNSYTGNTLVTNSGTLKLGSGSALGGGSGSTIIANGSTLDINGNYQNKPLIVSGAGVDGNGAIVNNGGGVYGFASQITLSGDTTFGYVGRSDLVNATISTGGNPYNLTINTPSAYFEWQNITADAALANINFVAGSWGWKNLTPTSFGNPAGTLTLTANTTVTMWSPSVINKNVDLQGGLMIVYSANNVMNGTMTLEDGYNFFQINGGCSLTLSNTLVGTDNTAMYVNDGDGILTVAGNSPSYFGIIYLNRGVVVLDGSIAGTVTTQFGSTLAGHGSAGNLVDVNSTFYPGNSGVVGTFTAGGLTLEGSANLTMDLSSSTAGSNDLVQVNGDLTMNGNNININPTTGTLANGTYPLIAYTGNFNGSIGTAATTYPTAYTLVLTNNTTAKQIQVIVSGTLNPSALVWNNANGTGQWDTGNSTTWSNVTTHAASSVFNTLDTVMLDDSILMATTPATNITIASTVVPSAITNNSSVNYTLSGSGKISGSGSLVKLGSGTLALNVSGDFTGPVTIGGGTLQTVGNNTLGSVAAITVTNGGTFDFAGHGYNRTNPIVIAGNGVNGHGAIYNSTGGIYGELLNIVMADDATIGQFGQGRYDLAPGSQISGAHNLTMNWKGDYAELNNITVGATVQNITLTNGRIGLKHLLNAFQNPATLFTVSSNSADIEVTFYDDGGANGFNGSLHFLAGSKCAMENVAAPVFNGSNIMLEDNVLLRSYSNSGSDVVFNSAITFNGIAQIVLGDHNMIFTNVLSGPGGFVMNYWNHAMIFSASNTYTGPTIINDGLQVTLTGNGSISQSALIFFGGGNPASIHLDASGRSDQTLALASGQTLAGIGAVTGKLIVGFGATISPAGTNISIGITAGSNATGTIGASSDVTLNGTTLLKLNGSGNNDAITSTGGSITYGGTLTLANISSTPVAAGDSFQLFNASSISGTFSSTNLPALNAGLVWDLSHLNTGLVQVASTSGPTIGSTTVSGGQLIFSGTGGTEGNSYAVLTTTNLINPNWISVATNTFGPGGIFNVTNTISGSTPQLFYRIQLLP